MLGDSLLRIRLKFRCDAKMFGVGAYQQLIEVTQAVDMHLLHVEAGRQRDRAARAVVAGGVTFNVSLVFVDDFLDDDLLFL